MQDPLSFNIATSGVDTSFPLMAEGTYRFQITESSVVPNKRQDGHNWKLKLNLVAPAPGLDGKEVAANSAVFQTIALQPAPEATDPQGFKRNIADAIDAIFGTTIDNRPAFNKDLWESAIGKEVDAHVVIDEYQGNKSNKVKRLKKVA